MKVPVPLALSTNVAVAGKLTADKVGVVASGSEAAALKLRLTPSFTDLGPIAASTGRWFALLTVITTSSESASDPSLAMKVTL